MTSDIILKKALNQQFIDFEEAVFLYKNTELSELVYVASNIREKINPGNEVGWIIDRNVNITNACFAKCKFCNFHCSPIDSDVYITSIEEYKNKIEELYKLGGSQLLLQGGMHPKLGLDFYVDLFRSLKKLYPSLMLHALGPPEIVFISKKEKISFRETLEKLIESGLDSLPGAGAEILCNRVRNIVSPAKCNVEDWLEVMKQAHILDIPTSATMMFGHIETAEERIEHLFKIRDLQSIKPKDSYGFLSFIPWPFQDKNTNLSLSHGVNNVTTSLDYIRLIALSRIVLTNVKNIQASWLTVGVETAKVCLNAGANDFGSIMIEENVVSSAGANYSLNKEQIVIEIKDAGFVPRLRNQKFEYLLNE